MPRSVPGGQTAMVRTLPSNLPSRPYDRCSRRPAVPWVPVCVCACVAPPLGLVSVALVRLRERRYVPCPLTFPRGPTTAAHVARLCRGCLCVCVCVCVWPLPWSGLRGGSPVALFVPRSRPGKPVPSCTPPRGVLDRINHMPPRPAGKSTTNHGGRRVPSRLLYTRFSPA